MDAAAADDLNTGQRERGKVGTEFSQDMQKERNSKITMKLNSILNQFCQQHLKSNLYYFNQLVH
jgi:hypothetical protein